MEHENLESMIDQDKNTKKRMIFHNYVKSPDGIFSYDMYHLPSYLAGSSMSKNGVLCASEPWAKC